MSTTHPGRSWATSDTFALRSLGEALPWLGLLLASGTFIADFFLPLGVAVGASYVLAILATFGHRSRNATLGMAALVSALTVIAVLGPVERASPIWVVVANRVLTLATVWGTAYFLLAFSRVSQRLKQMEFEAQTREAWLSQTLASIGDGVIATDPQGRIQFMNNVAERLTGWTETDACGCPLEQVFTIEDESSGYALESPVQHTLRRGAIVGLAEHTILRSRDGRTWPIDDSAAPIRDARNQLTGVVIIFREIVGRRRHEQQMELRLREAGHRIRNVFASIQAILTLCGRATTTPEEMAECIEARMASLLRSTDRLMRVSDQGSSLREIVIDEVGPFLEASSDRLHFGGDDVSLSPDAAVSFAMIVHELATNASKHGSLSREAGRLEIRCQQLDDGRVLLDWTEVGGPSASSPSRTGLGLRLIESLLKTQFSGNWEPQYTDRGFRCRLDLRPMPPLASGSSH